MVGGSVGKWKVVGGSVGRWSVGRWLVGRWLVVGGFNKTLPHTMFFFTFWKDKCIMTVRLAKAIFRNIHKISDACANSFDRYIMIPQCMRNVFTFY